MNEAPTPRSFGPPPDAAAFPPELLARTEANDLDRGRIHARLAAGGAILESGDLVNVVVSALLPPANAATLVRVPADLPRVLAEARAFWHGYGVSWTLKAIGATGAAVATLAAAAGLTLGEVNPGLLLSPLAGEAATVPGLLIRPVRTVADLHRFWETSAAGFGIDRVDLFASLYAPAALDLPDFTLYLGLLDGVPVATAVRFTSYRIAGLGGVSTVAAYRGRGIGAAITWRAALDGLAEGCVASYLQATAMGFPVYRRMGFRHVSDHFQWPVPAQIAT